ncbi:MAG: hypothetical protein KC931_23300 [Candidatus Omnitrophica bacterium]|nr:hypothetical protein [Candidatus Omnitrophota bacterium]MCB0338203.1 hypothetical protein [Bdellovibrionales bacterium]
MSSIVSNHAQRFSELLGRCQNLSGGSREVKFEIPRGTEGRLIELVVSPRMTPGRRCAHLRVCVVEKEGSTERGPIWVDIEDAEKAMPDGDGTESFVLGREQREVSGHPYLGLGITLRSYDVAPELSELLNASLTEEFLDQFESAISDGAATDEIVEDFELPEITEVSPPARSEGGLQEIEVEGALLQWVDVDFRPGKAAGLPKAFREGLTPPCILVGQKRRVKIGPPPVWAPSVIND